MVARKKISRSGILGLTFFGGFLVVCVLFYAAFSSWRSVHNPVPPSSQVTAAMADFDQGTIVLDGGESLSVLIARTPATQMHGLSDFERLDPFDGMLFAFEYPQQLSFWMKDMRFPLDIVWIDASKTVVDITYNALPESYPDTFSPKVPAQYVLELPAGKAQEFSITIGSPLSFD